MSLLFKKETSQVFHNDNDFINVKWFDFIKFICFFRIQRPVKVLKSTLEKIYSTILHDHQNMFGTSQSNVDDVKRLSAQVNICIDIISIHVVILYLYM